jgi:hypothetical protein
MWFWPIKEMTELVSSMPAPQFGGEFFSARMRAGSKFKRFLHFVFNDVRCFQVPSGVRLLQIEDHCPTLWCVSLH